MREPLWGKTGGLAGGVRLPVAAPGHRDAGSQQQVAQMSMLGGIAGWGWAVPSEGSQGGGGWSVRRDHGVGVGVHSGEPQPSGVRWGWKGPWSACPWSSPLTAPPTHFLRSAWVPRGSWEIGSRAEIPGWARASPGVDPQGCTRPLASLRPVRASLGDLCSPRPRAGDPS